jgi:hypothetical protein
MQIPNAYGSIGKADGYDSAPQQRSQANKIGPAADQKAVIRRAVCD